VRPAAHRDTRPAMAVATAASPFAKGLAKPSFLTLVGKYKKTKSLRKRV
jgi:hypothetical protein